ncbi:VOC family protein [Longispora albida]|uniref:VOC family protein n=1 Tax=Longispora albida TaxID=203523 RepID=UPI00037E23DE
MGSQLFAITFDAAEPARAGRFWAGLLGWELAEEVHGGVALLPGSGSGYRIRLVPAAEPKTVQNRMHFDLTSESPEGQKQTVSTALRLGGRHADVGQTGDEGHVVLADPEGNEFCVIEAGNNFLAGTGVIGALACDGSQAVGYFWAEALAWPLVWDENEETAIQSPAGGTKITWGGPPVEPKAGKGRVHFDLVPADGGGQQAEVGRLLALGATHAGTAPCGDGWVALADPDGNEFCVAACA